MPLYLMEIGCNALRPATWDGRIISYDNVVERLTAFPLMGSRKGRFGVRMFPVHGFPHVVFYVIEGEALVIVRIRHGARRPLTGADFQ